jgi:multicomponent Na+:H+ antiporter subunit B
MTSLILRTTAPLLSVVMILFSLFITLRGHNEPGGGFIGGLIAASAISVYAMSAGAPALRKAMRLHPLSYAGLGVVLAGLSGVLSLAFGLPYLTGLWSFLALGETEVALATPQLFDFGVYLVVFGVLSGIALALQGDDEEEGEER